MHAGPFGAWLTAARASLRGEGRGLDVPCGDCVGCCSSSLFVHVSPDETGTLAVIPKRLLVRAPGRPRGHLLLGFAGDGACPMLQARTCSIYEQRPVVCRVQHSLEDDAELRALLEQLETELTTTQPAKRKAKSKRIAT